MAPAEGLFTNISQLSLSRLVGPFCGTVFHLQLCTQDSAEKQEQRQIGRAMGLVTNAYRQTVLERAAQSQVNQTGSLWTPLQSF